jgi:hypothetical protein
MLKLSDVRVKLSFKIHETSLVFNVLDLLDYNIDYDVYLPSKGKNLQRAFCWSLEQKSEFILSVMKGIKIPNISIIQKRIYPKNSSEKEKTILQIIDGKQRLSTLLGFMQNEFPMKYNGVEYYYNDLEKAAQWEINHGMPSVSLAYEYEYKDSENVIISDDEKIAWFEMINFAGEPQDIEHLNNLKK